MVCDVFTTGTVCRNVEICFVFFLRTLCLIRCCFAQAKRHFALRAFARFLVACFRGAFAGTSFCGQAYFVRQLLFSATEIDSLNPHLTEYASATVVARLFCCHS